MASVRQFRRFGFVIKPHIRCFHSASVVFRAMESSSPNVAKSFNTDRVYLEDNARIFASKKTTDILRSLFVLKVCSYDFVGKNAMKKLCNHLNFRHRMAQYASRDSIDLHCQLFFQNKAITEEEAFVLFVRKNAIQVLIPKYGLEGTVFMAKDATGVVFNEEEPSLKIGDVTYRLFDRVLVKINVNESSTENKFLSFSLISRKENSVGDGEEPLSKKAKLS